MASSLLPTGIYGITDPKLLPGERLFTGVESALVGGCRVIQYRDKTSTDHERLENAKRLKALCHRYHASFIINDDLSLALASKADGLHLGKSDGRLDLARQALGSTKIIGVPCHSDLAYAQACIDQGASYCAFGRFFTSSTKPEAPPCELRTLDLATKLSAPVVAIGGIDVDNISRFRDTPPHSIAVINSLFGQANIEQAAHDLSLAFDQLAQTNP